jgi:FMN-dependent NADH-azoreductase
MTKLLYVVGSPRGENSESTAIADAFLEAYRDGNPAVEVDIVDLWREPLPVYGPNGVEAKMSVFAGRRPEGEQGDAWIDVLRVFERFSAADRYLFTVPMWNHGVPWRLKHLIDTITQPGLLFAFDPDHGYTGLLTGKKAAVIYTSGVYAPGRGLAFGADFHATYFNDWLRFAGVDDVSEVRFQPTIATADAEAIRRAAHAEARRLGACFESPTLAAA